MGLKTPFIDLIPSLTIEEFKQLEQNILRDGCLDALAVWNEILLDGHNRLKICEAHNVDYQITQIDLPNEIAAKEWIIRHQFGRRNLQPFQRAELALQLEGLFREKAKENQRQSMGAGQKGLQKSANLNPVDTRAELAQIAGVSHDTIAKAKVISERADDDAKEQLRKGETTINRVYTSILNDERKATNRDKKSVAPPEGTYNVIVIDPPWPVKKVDRDCRPNQSAELDYPTMSIDEIRLLNIPKADDCHLFCWTTNKLLPETFDIIIDWGFRYVLTMVWHKPGGFQPVGLPQYNCEFIVYARYGHPEFTDTKAFNVCFDAPRGKHSEKPEEFYQIIARVTDGKRLDMFSRRRIEGFDSWGNEV